MNDTRPSAINPRQTQIVRAGKVRWIVRHGIAHVHNILADPDRFLRDPALLISDSPLITMSRIPASVAYAPDLLLRRLNYGRPRHRWRDVFRLSRAERAFWYGLQLEEAGIHTPRTLAAGIDRFLRWPRRAYLLSEWLSGATSLEDWLKRHHGLPREQVYQLADLLARLHDQGFSHRDLKASNVLLDPRLRPWLIDLDGVRRFNQLSEHRAMLDLSRLGWEFVRYPKWFQWNGPRFLKRYCHRRGLQQSPVRLKILAPILQRLGAGLTRW